MDVLKSNRPLIVYLDVKSPYAFVSVKPTLALERELELQFDWRPYTLDIPSYLGSARKKKRGGGGVERAQPGNMECYSLCLYGCTPICRTARLYAQRY